MVLTRALDDHSVATVVAEQDVGAGRAHGAAADEAIVAGLAEHLVAAVTVEQEVAVVTAGDDIGAGVAVDLVAAGLALQAVVGRPAEDEVVTGAGRDDVDVGAAVEPIVTSSAADAVEPGPGEDAVRAIGAEDDVGSWCAVDVVGGAGRHDDRRHLALAGGGRGQRAPAPPAATEAPAKPITATAMEVVRWFRTKRVNTSAPVGDWSPAGGDVGCHHRWRDACCAARTRATARSPLRP